MVFGGVRVFHPRRQKTNDTVGNSMRGNMILIPKIKPTNHSTKQLAIPSLLQLKVDVFSAAAEDVKLVK